MSKKVLVTCTDSMMKQFLEPHIIELIRHGYEVELACSEVLNRFEEIQADLGGYVKIHRVSVRRNPLSPTNLNGYKQLKQIIAAGNYDLVWTNEPAMGVITRLAARKSRKSGMRVMYLVHGFHFYRGAPAINWILYYPIERIMSHKTDLICTINHEDFSRAKKMKAKHVSYIHGIGVDISRLIPDSSYPKLREELSVGDDAFLVLSVGELNKNKNQQVLIRAIALLQNPSVHLILCGIGNQQEALQKLAEKLNISRQVHFLGYRKDIANIYCQSDIFALPSKREGLGLASLEAMTFGLPIIGADVGGIRDYTKDGFTGILCKNNRPAEYADGIVQLMQALQSQERRALYSESCRKTAEIYLIEAVKHEVQAVIQAVFSE